MSNGGSTIRVGSGAAANGANRMMINSTRSSSSGLGSGTSRSRLSKLGGGAIYSKNMTIAALFPSQMPPVEKLNGGEVGKTVYDEDDVPRTEL